MRDTEGPCSSWITTLPMTLLPPSLIIMTLKYDIMTYHAHLSDITINKVERLINGKSSGGIMQQSASQNTQSG